MSDVCAARQIATTMAARRGLIERVQFTVRGMRSHTRLGRLGPNGWRYIIIGAPKPVPRTTR